jgi:hypothetical protein
MRRGLALIPLGLSDDRLRSRLITVASPQKYDCEGKYDGMHGYKPFPTAPPNICFCLDDSLFQRPSMKQSVIQDTCANVS